MPTQQNEAPVLVITGPTASGKSALAHAVALQTGAEIISADSRQIYRELTIGSAKPTPEMLEEAPYHFINEKDITEPYSAGAFATEARERITQIQKRNNPVIVAGGSTLYLQGLIEGFSDLPPADPNIRQQLKKELAEQSSEALYNKLQHLDPERAATLDHTKTHRLIRALEIQLTTRGRCTLRALIPEITFTTLALNLPREELYGRINLRVEEMMTEGLLPEAEALWQKYRHEISCRELPALLTVGYQELFDHLEGKTSLEEAVTLIKQHTRNYAKRQLTFLRNRMQLNWIDAPQNEEQFSQLTSKISHQLEKKRL
ncbi:MAG: tRNA (adenosine(37)-N6)-dimethylallyltransferase MiaA [Candidatus Chlorobium antarcticum]|nr:tRNA (adenosine(37)-N6)-dimethylallyltransferase MiaA [Candidatus Chlorobium antarcticum]